MLIPQKSDLEKGLLILGGSLSGSKSNLILDRPLFANLTVCSDTFDGQFKTNLLSRPYTHRTWERRTIRSSKRRVTTEAA